MNRKYLVAVFLIVPLYLVSIFLFVHRVFDRPQGFSSDNKTVKYFLIPSYNAKGFMEVHPGEKKFMELIKSQDYDLVPIASQAFEEVAMTECFEMPDGSKIYPSQDGFIDVMRSSGFSPKGDCPLKISRKEVR